jgi:hypothetical protein
LLIGYRLSAIRAALFAVRKIPTKRLQRSDF